MVIMMLMPTSFLTHIGAHAPQDQVVTFAAGQWIRSVLVLSRVQSALPHLVLELKVFIMRGRVIQQPPKV